MPQNNQFRLDDLQCTAGPLDIRTMCLLHHLRINLSYTHSQIGPYTLCDNNNLAGSLHVTLCEMGPIKSWLQFLADSQTVCILCVDCVWTAVLRCKEQKGKIVSACAAFILCCSQIFCFTLLKNGSKNVASVYSGLFHAVI